MVGELVGIEPLAVPGGAHLCEQVDVEVPRLENPGSLAPVVVDGEQVVQFGDGGAHACERVALGTPQVGVSFEEYGIEVVRVERILVRVGTPVEYAANLAAGGETRARKRALQAPVGVQAELVDVEVPVLGLDGAACRHGKAFGEGARAVEVGIRVLVVQPKPVALSGNLGAFLVVAVEADGDESADPLLVSPVEVVFVQVEVRPVVTECDLQGIDALEDAVAGAAYDGLHGNGVIARADAVAVVGADVFVADGVLARVVRVGVSEREVDGRAPVFPGGEEFLFLFGIESVAVDVVKSVAEFE